MLVLLAIMSPLTLCEVSMQGLFLESATWMEAGPHSMKLAILFSRVRCKDLWICVASISPWITFSMDMYLPCRVGALTMIFLGSSNLRITSSTVVLRMLDTCLSTVSGVYPVMRKWHLGVGTSEASMPTISLFMQLGQRRVAVEAAMTVDTRELTWLVSGLRIFSLSTTILLRAGLSSTTTESAFWMSLFIVSMELQGCTTTSDTSSFWLGNTEQVEIIFLGNFSFNFSRRQLPMPLPVPPAIECSTMNPSKLSEPSASRSIISMISSCTFSPCVQPLAQLLPAPLPSLEMNTFSGLQSCEQAPVWMELMTRGSRSMSRDRGTQWSSSAWQKNTSFRSQTWLLTAYYQRMPEGLMPCYRHSCFQNQLPTGLGRGYFGCRTGRSAG